MLLNCLTMKKFLCPLALSLFWVSAGCVATEQDNTLAQSQPNAPVEAQKLTVTLEKDATTYAPGQPITWNIRVSGGGDTVQKVNYTVKKDGQTVLSEGVLPLPNGAAQLQTKLDGPGAVLANFSLDNAGNKKVEAVAGALVAPFKIEPSRPEPADFMSFWKSNIEKLEKVPINPVLTAQPISNPDVDYYKVTLDSVGDTHVQGQLARPKKGDKFPALVRFQYAGVYGLDRGNVVSQARNGWLTLNISAHDLPIDESGEFYAAQSKGPLKDYFKIGAQSRETSYFLGMALRCYRAIDYLKTRPDWDGKTLVVEGTSQGGLQSLMMGALNPAVTAVIVNVPAGNDTTGPLAGRAAPWPYWAKMEGDQAQILETSRYFDGVNFARHVKVPTLMAVGLLDTVATPVSALSAFNSIQSPAKKLLIMPKADHQGRGGTQSAYYQNSSLWLKALVNGETPPTS